MKGRGPGKNGGGDSTSITKKKRGRFSEDEENEEEKEEKKTKLYYSLYEPEISVVYQSLCVGNISNYEDDLSNHGKMKNQTYIKGAFSNNSREISTYINDPAQKKADFIPEYVTTICKQCILPPNIIVIGELEFKISYTKNSTFLVGSTNYTICDSVVGGSGSSEQRNFTLIYNNSIEKNITKLLPALSGTVEGAVSMTAFGVELIFVHIPTTSARDNMKGYLKLLKLKETGGWVLLGDTNEKTSGRLKSEYTRKQGSEDEFSEASQGPVEDASYTVTWKNTGGGENAYHDTIFTKDNLLKFSREDDKRRVFSTKGLLQNRLTIVATNYMDRDLDTDLFTDHRGVHALIYLTNKVKNIQNYAGLRLSYAAPFKENRLIAQGNIEFGYGVEDLESEKDYSDSALGSSDSEDGKEQLLIKMPKKEKIRKLRKARQKARNKKVKVLKNWERLHNLK